MKHESIELLSRYRKIDTANQPGNEARGVDFFTEILDREEISYKIYEPSPGRCSLRAVIPGTDEKGPVILLNHIDVVPAKADQWSSNPFGGEVKNGYIHGRGALDMKGQGIMEFLAFLEIWRKRLSQVRDIIFLAVADEETDGTCGVRHLVEKHPDDFNADLVLNEGGYLTNELLPNRQVFMVSTAEKGACWLRLKISGPPGHGSLPHGNNASDSRFFRENGIVAYGVNPSLLSSDDLKMFHGNNEKISEENMIKGTKVYSLIVKALCL
ncbi:M20/M25/M40 family metallo-hydrolase [Desulfococcaceae bacterium HSG7]|nr:M20/M25/M40 family metallo-hydrolase [Desulfococcaceae bacterium HSG7]